jgi:hypothetical protein
MPNDVTAWFGGRLPAEWFTSTEITLDRDEVIVIGTIAAPEDITSDGDDARGAAEAGRIARFREQTRDERIQVAREAEVRFGRKIAWGVTCGETTTVFTSIAAPVMTRLRQPERIVLDTLVDAGVARSRSHALAWCVRLVGQHSSDWLAELRTALTDVERLRSAGPDAAAS